MAWRSIEKKIIGSISITEKGTPAPTPTSPEDVIEDWLKVHDRLGKVISRYGKKGECLSVETLMKDGRVGLEEAQQHLQVFESHDYVGKITDDGAVCGRDAIAKLKKTLEVEL